LTFTRETVIRCVYPGHDPYRGWPRRYEDGPTWCRTVETVHVRCEHEQVAAPDHDPGDEDRE
jgi:hypothetical protein